MKHILLFLSFITCLLANTAVTENDPSTFVNGVSMITGDLYTFDEDLVVAGTQPIRYQRGYLSSVGDVLPDAHFMAEFQVLEDQFVVSEANGTQIYYRMPKQNAKEKKKKKPLRYNASIIDSPGVTNTASGKITAQTNYRNQYLVIESDKWITMLPWDKTPKQRFDEQQGMIWGVSSWARSYSRSAIYSVAFISQSLSPWHDFSTPVADLLSKSLNRSISRFANYLAPYQYGNADFNRGRQIGYWGAEATSWAVLGFGAVKTGMNIYTTAAKNAALLNFLGSKSLKLNGPACSATNYLKLRNHLSSIEIANGHAFEKHVLQKMEFGSCTRDQFRSHIENCLNNYSAMKNLSHNRTAYWHSPSNTVIIRDPARIDGGTAFKPDLLYEYFKGDALK